MTEPYAGFLELLTFGILPQNLWFRVPANSASLAELNLKPIGSGPYKFKSLVKDKIGNIRSYHLVSNDEYYGAKPYVADLIFKFFVNTEEAVAALNENSIDGIGYLPFSFKEEIISQDSLNFYKLKQPQILGLFLNKKTNMDLCTFTQIHDLYLPTSHLEHNYQRTCMDSFLTTMLS